MLFDLATFEDAPTERLLRRYTEFRGDDGQVHWAQSVDSMSAAWVARTLERVEVDWRSIPLGGGNGQKPNPSAERR